MTEAHPRFATKSPELGPVQLPFRVPSWLHVVWTWWRNHAQPVQWLAATVQSLATVLAIIIGAVWALTVFFRKRERFPQLNVEHSISDWRAGQSTVLHLTIRVVNRGSVVGHIRTAKAWVQQILPTPDDVATSIAGGEDPVENGASEISWPLATNIRECDWSASPREIEPNETDEFHFDFVLPPHIRAVQVYSHLRNHMKAQDIGWNTTTVYTLTGEQHGKVADVRATDEISRASEANASSPEPEAKVTTTMTTPTETRQGPPKATPQPPQPPPQPPPTTNR